MFAVNVPYNVPVEEFWINNKTLELEYYKILNEKVVLFKPREWRGDNITTCKMSTMEFSGLFICRGDGIGN